MTYEINVNDKQCVNITAFEFIFFCEKFNANIYGGWPQITASYNDIAIRQSNSWPYGS
jgi:hypothetical protein